MNEYQEPYSIEEISTLHLPLFRQTSKYKIMYEEVTEVCQCSTLRYAQELCDAMNIAHRAGWFDGRAFEKRNVV